MYVRLRRDPSSTRLVACGLEGPHCTIALYHMLLYHCVMSYVKDGANFLEHSILYVFLLHVYQWEYDYNYDYNGRPSHLDCFGC